MASIFKNVFDISEDTDFLDMQPSIDAYWGKSTLEKNFPISLWKMKQLFDAFPSSEVALKVTDIFSTTLVNAEWIAFDESLEGVLVDPKVQSSTNYYVLSESDFTRLRKAANDKDDNFVLIIGRIGKEVTSAGTDYYAFICTGAIEIITPDVGGGDGASTGFKIPPPK
jgi:hypothetical protein